MKLSHLGTCRLSALADAIEIVSEKAEERGKDPDKCLTLNVRALVDYAVTRGDYLYNYTYNEQTR